MSLPSYDISGLSTAQKFLLVCAASFLLAFVGGAVVYYAFLIVLQNAFDTLTPIGYLFRMSMYPDKHPLQYTAVVAFPFAVATAWSAAVMRPPVGHRRWLRPVWVILPALFASSAIGGALYQFHDMQAGSFPSADRAADYLMQGVGMGLNLGPFIVALSFPANVLAFAWAYMIVLAMHRSCTRP